MINLERTDEPCDECSGEEDVLLLVVMSEHTRHFPSGAASMALCGACRIRTEAILRGSRKAGPRVGQWHDNHNPNREVTR